MLSRVRQTAFVTMCVGYIWRCRPQPRRVPIVMPWRALTAVNVNMRMSRHAIKSARPGLPSLKDAKTISTRSRGRWAKRRTRNWLAGSIYSGVESAGEAVG